MKNYCFIKKSKVLATKLKWSRTGFLNWRNNKSEHNNCRVMLTQAKSPSSTVSWLCWWQKPLDKCLKIIPVYVVPRTCFGRRCTDVRLISAVTAASLPLLTYTAQRTIMPWPSVLSYIHRGQGDATHILQFHHRKNTIFVAYNITFMLFQVIWTGKGEGTAQEYIIWPWHHHLGRAGCELSVSVNRVRSCHMYLAAGQPLAFPYLMCGVCNNVIPLLGIKYEPLTMPLTAIFIRLDEKCRKQSWSRHSE